MALPIRDGNQSLTTLSTLIVNSAHVPAHTVVSLGSQAITDIAQAVSGVELGPNSISALEHISVTISAGTSITIGNVVSVTGGLTNAELRASSVTIGGSVQVSNFPATQAVTFTTAPVTFGQAVVSASNIGDILSSVGTDNTADATTKFFKIGGHQDGQNQTSHIVHVSAGGAMKVDASDSTITFGAIRGTVTVGNSVTIANFPVTQAVTFGQTTITGSVSVLNLSSITIGQVTVTGGLTNAELRASAVTVSGTVTANLVAFDVANEDRRPLQIADTGVGLIVAGSTNPNDYPVIVSGTVTANGIQNQIEEGLFGSDQLVNNLNSGLSLSANVPISGTVTVGNVVTFGTGGVSSDIGIKVFGFGHDNGITYKIPVVEFDTGEYAGEKYLPAIVCNDLGRIRQGNEFPVKGTVTVGNSVTIGSLPAISGTVTANLSSTNLNSVTIGVRGSVTVGNTVTIAGVVTSGLTGINNLGNQIPVAAFNWAETQASGGGRLSVAISDFDGRAYGEDIPAFPVNVSNSITIGNSLTISGTVTANGFDFNNSSYEPIPLAPFDENASGGRAVVAKIVDDNGVGLNFSVGVPISGTVTANVLGYDGFNGTYPQLPVGRANDGYSTNDNVVKALIGLESGSVNVANPLPVSGTVTANNPSGALTTRFGSVTTAGVVQATTAVTNSSRKYLLVQNPSISAVTIGIGFTPTTTQGITLYSGGGLTFDSFAPTGAVYWLSSVTNSNIIVIEG